MRQKNLCMGMQNAVTSKTNFLYIFPPNGYERNRMEKLFDYYTKQGYCLFGINSKQVDENIKYILNCKFTDDPEFSILEIYSACTNVVCYDITGKKDRFEYSVRS